MATVTTTIGSATNNVDITGVSGTGPYTVTLASMPSDAAIGDRLRDEAATQKDFLVTGISGSDLTVTDVLGASAAPSAAGSTQAVLKRCWSSVQAWEDAIDNTTLYPSSPDIVGNCYADSDLDGVLLFNGGATSTPASVTLTAPEGERHDGTASGGGFRMYRSTGATQLIDCRAARAINVSWLHLDLNTQVRTGVEITQTAGTITVDKCVIHGSIRTAGDNRGIHLPQLAITANFTNNVIYAIGRDSGTGAAEACGIGDTGVAIMTAKTQRRLNNTIYNITSVGAGPCEGLHINTDSANHHIKNNVVVGTANSGSGSSDDYDTSISTTTNMSNNASEDATAPGSDSITTATTADFVSVTGGSEDLHLTSASAVEVDAGVDLVTTPTGVNIDIDGRDRDAEGDTWDIGAHEFVAAGGGASSYPAMRSAFRQRASHILRM